MTERALLAAPSSVDALREVALKVANDGWQAGYRVANIIRDGHSWFSTQENECAAIVARVLSPEGKVTP